MRHEDHDLAVAELNQEHDRRVTFHKLAFSRIRVALTDERIAEAEQLAGVAGQALIYWVPINSLFTDAGVAREALMLVLYEATRKAAGLTRDDDLEVLAVCWPDSNRPPRWWWAVDVTRERLLSLLMSTRPARKVRGITVRPAERGMYVAFVFNPK